MISASQAKAITIKARSEHERVDRVLKTIEKIIIDAANDMDYSANLYDYEASFIKELELVENEVLPVLRKAGFEILREQNGSIVVSWSAALLDR